MVKYSHMVNLKCNTTKEFSIAFYVKFKKIELSYRIHLKFNINDTHISWKGYLIGSLTPKINIHLMAYKKKTRQSEDVYRQKSYFHFRFNTNSGGFFPMQLIFYLKLAAIM